VRNKPHGPWGGAVGVVVLHLLSVAVLEPGMNIWPPKAGDLIWRVVFGTQTISGFGLVILALALVALSGVVTRRRGPLRLVLGAGVLAMVLSGVVVISTALDYFQLRSTLRPESILAWDTGVAVPLVMGLMAAMAFLILAVGANTALGAIASTDFLREPRPGPGLIVGQAPKDEK